MFDVDNKNRENTIEWINKIVANKYRNKILKNLPDKEFYNFYKFELMNNPKRFSLVWIFSDEVKSNFFPEDRLMGINPVGVEYLEECFEEEGGKKPGGIDLDDCPYLLGRDENSIKLHKIDKDYKVEQKKIIPGTCTKDFSETQAIINFDEKTSYTDSGSKYFEAKIELLDIGKKPLKLKHVVGTL